MTRPKPSGSRGEEVAGWILERSGWEIVDHQVKAAGGHVLDMLAVHPVTHELWLVEVKAWGRAPSGKDTVKKAIGDAYDLQQAGEQRPLLLVISHQLTGLLADMLTRARRAGAINEVRILGSTEDYG